MVVSHGVSLLIAGFLIEQLRFEEVGHLRSAWGQVNDLILSEGKSGSQSAPVCFLFGFGLIRDA